MSLDHFLIEAMQTAGKALIRKVFTSSDATITLTVDQQICLTDSTSNVGTVVLPPVAEARGKLYSIIDIGPAGAGSAGTNTVTLTDNNDDSHDASWGDISINADLDRALLYSDGIAWWVISDMFT